MSKNPRDNDSSRNQYGTHATSSDHIRNVNSIADSHVFAGKRSMPDSGDLSSRRKHHDYLKEMREKNKRASDFNSNKVMIDQVLKDKNLNEYERMEAVKRRANQMEEKARMQEQLINIEKAGDMSYQESVEKTIAVNDMYIDAIQAKLKILD